MPLPSTQKSYAAGSTLPTHILHENKNKVRTKYKKVFI